MRLARFLAVLPLLPCLAGWAQSPETPAPSATWFTVAGDPAQPQVNTVQVDPATISADGNKRSIRLRVNRAGPRTSWDGVPYRSYDAMVLVDCTARTARYQSIAFFKEPLWEGVAHRNMVYPSTAEPRWMAFKAMEPNPTGRIIHAACQIT